MNVTCRVDTRFGALDCRRRSAVEQSKLWKVVAARGVRGSTSSLSASCRRREGALRLLGLAKASSRESAVRITRRNGEERAHAPLLSPAVTLPFNTVRSPKRAARRRGARWPST